MSLLTGLKRRNVFRVAALYAVGSWLLLQVGDILFGLMGLPDWALRIVLGILLLGFPVALVLAWIYELTPEGIKREQDIEPGESIVNETGHKHANDELYDALVNPEGDHAALRRRLARFLEENSLESSTVIELLIALGDFDRDSLGFAFWLSPHSRYRQSDGFKRRIRRQGIDEYWRQAGFPPMCQPLGEDDFECR